MTMFRGRAPEMLMYMRRAEAARMPLPAIVWATLFGVTRTHIYRLALDHCVRGAIMKVPTGSVKRKLYRW